MGPETLTLGAARALGLLRSTFQGTSFELDSECKVEGQDAVLIDVDLSGADLTGGWKRTRFERCRLMGCDFGEAVLRDVTFVGCALDLSGFRKAKLERVHFEACRVDEVDFSGATLTDVAFTDGVVLATVAFDGTRHVNVDVRGADLTGVEVANLSGCIIDPVQLIAVAPGLARAAKITVRSLSDDLKDG